MTLNKEAAAIIGVVVTIILGALQTLSGEGFISEALAGNLSDAVNAGAELLLLAAPFLTGLLIRFNVFSKDTTQKLADRAAATGNTDIGNPPRGTRADGRAQGQQGQARQGEQARLEEIADTSDAPSTLDIAAPAPVHDRSQEANKRQG